MKLSQRSNTPTTTEVCYTFCLLVVAVALVMVVVVLVIVVPIIVVVVIIRVVAYSHYSSWLHLLVGWAVFALSGHVCSCESCVLVIMFSIV